MTNSATATRDTTSTKPAGQAPGPAWYTAFGNTLRMQRDPLHFLLEAARQYGDVVHLSLIFGTFYLINHPDGVKHVLQENNRNYDKNVFDYNILRQLLGRGLLTDDGESWLRQRRLMQPAFHRQRIAAFGTLMSDATVDMLERWSARAKADEPLDIAQEMVRLTLKIVGQALFDLDLSAETDTVGQAFLTVNRHLSEYLYQPFVPLGVPTPRNRRFWAASRELNQVVDEIIQQRRLRNEDTGDLLSMLLLARDEETGQGMDDRQLRDEVLTLLLAGHETTSNALSWTWYLLSQHPGVEQRLREELDRVLAGRLPTVNDLPELPYSRMVIEEAMRLYPPAWAFSRNVLKGDEIGGYRIPRGSIVLLCPYTTHRHPAFWHEPERFDPERFAAGQVANRPRYAYFPFGGGPRQCIGNNFALIEAQIILTTVLQRYSLHLAPHAVVQPEPLITLRPRYGLPMTLHPTASLVS
ncbi:MAG: cytochrome P450 [Ktedonobacteraceae bacterium]|nr:cytochrome P450 [Ktedonobacteraceae bacterium]